MPTLNKDETKEAMSGSNSMGYARLAYRTLRHLIAHRNTFRASLKGYLERHVQRPDSRQQIMVNDEMPTAPIIIYLPRLTPLRLVLDPALAGRPCLNVLIPNMALSSMSGGPNTAINLTYRLAEYGIPLRYISTDAPLDGDLEDLWRHFSSLTGIQQRYTHVEIASDSNRAQTLAIGENDVFLGTAWWTVQLIKQALPLTKR